MDFYIHIIHIQILLSILKYKLCNNKNLFLIEKIKQKMESEEEFEQINIMPKTKNDIY